MAWLGMVLQGWSGRRRLREPHIPGVACRSTGMSITCAHDPVSLNQGPRPSQHSYLDTVLLELCIFHRFWSTSMGCG